ncbi:MAG: class I SAM-dependent methyltransferase [Burkholderiales bacterium]
MRTLTHAEARSFYDKFGSKQDQQMFYEEAALSAMVSNAALEQAQSVVEFGCGTGRLALQLLQRHLPESARYLGTDLSSTMVAIATERLRPYTGRASAVVAAGAPALPVQDASVDRLISTYVFDLLSEAEREEFLIEATRVLGTDGLLCLAGITNGNTPVSRAVMAAWQWLFALNPRWVGGCRPTRASEYLSARAWQILYHETFVSWGIASEVVIASPRAMNAQA